MKAGRPGCGRHRHNLGVGTQALDIFVNSALIERLPPLFVFTDRLSMDASVVVGSSGRESCLPTRCFPFQGRQPSPLSSYGGVNDEADH